MKMTLVKNNGKYTMKCYGEIITTFNEASLEHILRWIKRNLKSVEVEVINHDGKRIVGQELGSDITQSN